MIYKPGDTYYGEFITSDDRGVAVNADALPVATVRKNAADDGTSPTGWTNSLIVTNIDTGRYQVTGTIPVGYSADDVIRISIAATVDGEAGKAVIDTFILTANNLDDVVTDIAALPTDADVIAACTASLDLADIPSVITIAHGITDAAIAAILDEDIDSTGGEAITVLKALEALLAAVVGKTVISTVDSDTKRVQFLGRDELTVIAQVDVSTTTSGSREDSLIDPP